MKTTILAAGVAAAAAMVFVAGAAHAHHSFAMFDESQHRLIEGARERADAEAGSPAELQYRTASPALRT